MERSRRRDEGTEAHRDLTTQRGASLHAIVTRFEVVVVVLHLGSLVIERVVVVNGS